MIATDRYLIRTMTEADIAQVAEIEAESFPTTWPRTAYRRELTNKLARYVVLLDRMHAPVVNRAQPKRSFFGFGRRPATEEAATHDFIVGYVGLWFMVDEAHVVAIAVRESYRGRGLGELLLCQALDLALENNQDVVTLEVRRSNSIAQALYEKYRFLKVGVRRRYYSDNHEDAIIMSTPPIQADSYREFLAYLKQQLAKKEPGTRNREQEAG
jgi:[ribosomal protein S18]-alanine N-acetyltransferase